MVHADEQRERDTDEGAQAQACALPNGRPTALPPAPLHLNDVNSIDGRE